MPKWESRLLTWIHRRILWLGGAAVLLLSLYARYSFWSLNNSDIATLASWVGLAREGGFAAMLAQVDYSPVYYYLFFVLSRLPLPLTDAGLVKLLFVGFEYLCIGACAVLLYRLSAPERKGGNAFVAFALLCLSPVMVLNAAGWGQCDATYTLFVVLSVLAVMRDRPAGAAVLFGLALCFKLQAVFALPAFLYVWFTRREKSFLYLLLIPLVIWLMGLPLALFGASPMIGFSVYWTQGNSQVFWVTKNYPGFYALLGALLDPFQVGDYTHLYMFIRYGLALCAGVVGTVYVVLLRRGAVFEKSAMPLLYAWTALACVFFLPHMHERYGMMGEVFLLCYAVARGKPVYYLLWVLATAMSTLSYGDFLFMEQITPQQVGAYVNLGILFVLTVELFRTGEKGRSLEAV